MIDFYYLPASPPCRAVMMLAKAIGVRLNLKIIDILKGENLKPEYIKMNPQHTIPTLNDNGFILWESRAMMIYLVSKYAKNDALYSKDSRKKGVVDQRLYFDIGTLYENLFKTYFVVMFEKVDKPREEDVLALERSFEVLNVFLQERRFVAGDSITVADFSIVTTVSSAQAFGFDIGRYDYVATWYQRCRRDMEKFGFDEINLVGARTLGTMYKRSLKAQA